MKDELVKGRVSILVPCFNGEKYIQNCINSIVSQTWDNIELILVNDGSKDDTDLIIKKNYNHIEKKLANFIYIKQENQGVGAAINNALKKFTGEFLATMDCDDYMMPNAIETRAKWLQEHLNTAVVINNGYYIKENDPDYEAVKFSDINIVKENIDLFNLIIEGKIHHWPASYMIRSQVWINRNTNRDIYPSRNGQNVQLLLPAAYHNKCDYIPNCLMKYNMHEGSLSNSINKKEEKLISEILGYQDIYMNVVDSVLSSEEAIEYKDRISNYFTFRIWIIMIECKDKQGAKEYYKIIKKNQKVNPGDLVKYYRLVNPAIAFFLRIYRRIHK